MALFKKIDYTNLLVLVVAVVVAILISPMVKGFLPEKVQSKLG